MGELIDLWRRIESLGFDWISIWDHFYALDGQSSRCLEAVAAHAALACATERVRVGSLVYCAAYRHPAVLANAIATIDDLSRGRTTLGIGAGWAEAEFRAYGIAFDRAGPRLDRLDEFTRVVRSLLRDEVSNFNGEYFTLTNARCEPKPLQSNLPIWIGGGGERRTLRIAAQLADGWNIPFATPAVFRHKRSVLHAHCETVGRDPREIRCSVNVGLAWNEDSLLAQFGANAERARPSVLSGSDGEVTERIGAYVASGADQINISMRAPFEPEAIERLSPLLNAFRDQ
jgi:F420-dependent oxidoreductase-like protein